MNRLRYPTLAVASMSLTVGAVGFASSAEADGLPGDCPVREVGFEVSAAAERALIGAGFDGIIADGIISNPNEQFTVYKAQAALKSSGFMRSTVKICGTAFNTTELAANLKANKTNSPDLEIASSSKVSLDRCKVEPAVIERIGDQDTIFDAHDVQEIQTALNKAGISVGRADGEFGPRTKGGILEFQLRNGLFPDCVLGPMTAAKLFSDSQNTSTQAEASAPSNVNRCVYNSVSSTEAARLLGKEPSIVASNLCELVKQFQAEKGLKIDGVVGPITATSLIVESPNPCNIYSSDENDCVIGIQKADNLGVVYVVEDGEVIRRMSARFGNPARKNGQLTPEGQFTVQRTKKGEHISTNCIDENGNGYVCMWNSLYFKNGIAIHGTKTPENPNGSLGCVGVSIEGSEFIYAQYENGKIAKIVIVDFQRN